MQPLNPIVGLTMVQPRNLNFKFKSHGFLQIPTVSWEESAVAGNIVPRVQIGNEFLAWCRGSD
jgi:hypothetical protein